MATNRRQRPFFHRFDRGKRAECALFDFSRASAYPLGSRSRRYFCARPSQSLFFPPVKKERLTGIRSRTDPELDSVREGTRDRQRSTREGAKARSRLRWNPPASSADRAFFPGHRQGARLPPPRAPTPDPIAPETRPTRRSLPAPRRAPVARSRRRASLPREARPSRLPPRRFEARLRIGRGTCRGATAGITA